MSDLSRDLVIDDDNYLEFVEDPTVDGHRMGRGLVQRDYSRVPYGSIRGVEPFNLPLLARNEWSSRIRDMEQSRSRLSDLREIGNFGQRIVSMDQNGQGYCWAYSPASAITLVRARDHQPYVRLSAHGPACKIKNFRDQGGWNPQAVQWAIEHGYPTVDDWAEKSMSRSHDNPQTWANARRFRVTEGWMELTPRFWDRNLTFDQLMTCLLLRIPCPVDLMWWRHSVCAADPVEVDSSLPLSDIRRWGIRIWNSWRDAWGTNGMGVIRGQKAVPDGATAIKVVTHHSGEMRVADSLSLSI